MYFCRICNKYFYGKKIKKKGFLRREYSEGKQTQKQIAKKIKRSREWVNRNLKKGAQYSGKNKEIDPTEIILIIDTTYFKQFGLMVFRASNLKKNLLWKIVAHETNQEYRLGIQSLLDDGFTIFGIVADGKPGLKKLFPDIPFQLCQFHQFQRVTQLISKNPKLEASQELRQIMFHLKETDKVSFEFWLQNWHEKWRDFLGEKTIDTLTGKSHFTHQRLRKAFFSIRRNRDFLFTFQFHSELLILTCFNNFEVVK